MEVYKQLVQATALQTKENPDINDDQLLGYIQYLGVFVPHVRDRILKEAKEIGL